jgi:uncharacterized Tic20 family protein
MLWLWAATVLALVAVLAVLGLIGSLIGRVLQRRRRRMDTPLTDQWRKEHLYTRNGDRTRWQ